MNESSHARLKLISQHLKPEEISSLVGMLPDRARRSGDKRPHTTIVESTNCWEIRSDISENRDLGEHIDAVLRRVDPIADRISEFAKHEQVLLSCIVYSSATPAIGLTADAIRKLARLGAEVDFDLYLAEGGT